MSYLHFSTEQDFLKRFTHISVGPMKLRIVSSDDFEQMATNPTTDWFVYGFKTDFDIGIAAVRVESLQSLLDSSSASTTIDEDLPWCFILPDTLTDGINPGWMFRNNVRYHCSRHLYQNVTEVGGPMTIDLEFEQDPSDRAYILHGATVEKAFQLSSELTEEYSESRVDAEFNTNFAVNRPLTISDVETFYATLYPRFENLEPSIAQDLADIVVVCADDTLNFSPHFTVRGAILDQHKNLALSKLKIMIPKDESGTRVLILQDFNHASISISKEWLGFAHLEHTSLTVRLPEDGIIQDHAGTRIYYPRSTPDFGIYQIRAPFSHSNALGTKDDLLVKIAELSPE